MSDLSRQEQIEYILDHYENPRNRAVMPDADVHVEGGHPGCSDLITIYLKFNGDQIEKISFVGEGCTISQAGASIITELAEGKRVVEIENFDQHTLVDEMGEEAVRTRPKCATLGLDVLKAALRAHRNQQRRETAQTV